MESLEKKLCECLVNAVKYQIRAARTGEVNREGVRIDHLPTHDLAMDYLTQSRRFLDQMPESPERVLCGSLYEAIREGILRG